MLSFCLICCFAFAQGGYKQDLNNLISVNFPAKPESMDTLGQKIYKFTDSDAFYMALVKEHSVEDLLISTNKLSEFYDGTINGVLGASKGRLISKKAFTVAGLKGVEIEYVTTANPALPDLRFNRMLLINNTFISLNCLTLSKNKQATEAVRKHFFNSIALIAKETDLKQGTDDPTAYAIGYVIGKIAAWAVLLVIIAGVIFLIKKITTRSKIS